MTAAKIGTAPLSIPASEESIHCCPIGNSSNGAAIQTTPSSATRGRSLRSTGRWDPRNSESVSIPTATRPNATTPGPKCSRPISMNRKDEPHMAAIAARSPHSCGPNASRLVPSAVSISGRLLMPVLFLILWLTLRPPTGSPPLVRTHLGPSAFPTRRRWSS